MYEAVYAHPDGDSTAARYALTAADYGFDGVVVRAVDAAPDYDRFAGAYGVDVVDAVEVVADDPASASGAVGNFRPKHDLVLVRGGTDRVNRFAVEQERVDVLTRPMDDEGDFNHVLARAAADNDVAVEFDFGPVLRSEGGQRVRALQNLRKLRELVDHYDTPFVVSATPSSHLELRAQRELKAVGETVGFDAADVAAGLQAWGDIAARNRERRSESFVAPGVELSGPGEEKR